MGKLSLCVFVVALCFGYLKADFSACEPIGCPDVIIPASCRATTFYVDANDDTDQLCQGCDACIEKVNDDMLDNGCPLTACTMQYIPDNCRRERYYIYQGRKVCKDCPEDKCRHQ